MTKNARYWIAVDAHAWADAVWFGQVYITETTFVGECRTLFHQEIVRRWDQLNRRVKKKRPLPQIVEVTMRGTKFKRLRRPRRVS